MPTAHADAVGEDLGLHPVAQAELGQDAAHRGLHPGLGPVPTLAVLDPIAGEVITDQPTAANLTADYG